MAIIEDTKGRIFNEPRFPMKFKECLRRIIGGRSFGNRLHLFRQFWSAKLNESSEYQTEAARLDEVSEQISYYNLHQVSAGAYADIARGFHAWRKERDRQQRVNAIKSRWDKQKRKKSLASRKKHKK